jgi:hypothetical protein
MEEGRWKREAKKNKRRFTTETRRTQRESFFSLPGDTGNEKQLRRFAGFI